MVPSAPAAVGCALCWVVGGAGGWVMIGGGAGGWVVIGGGASSWVVIGGGAGGSVVPAASDRVVPSLVACADRWQCAAVGDEDRRERDRDKTDDEQQTTHDGPPRPGHSHQIPHGGGSQPIRSAYNPEYLLVTV